MRFEKNRDAINPHSPEGRAIRRISKYMLDELETNFHEVILIPAPDPQHTGHAIRIVQSQNARWYSRFADDYQSARGRMIRARTFIIKTQAATALRRLVAGNFRGTYAERLIDFIQRERSNHYFARHYEPPTATIGEDDGIYF